MSGNKAKQKSVTATELLIKTLERFGEEGEPDIIVVCYRDKEGNVIAGSNTEDMILSAGLLQIALHARIHGDGHLTSEDEDVG